jgi:hypothetical protein
MTRQPYIHDLKIWPAQFSPMRAGTKLFELRWNDRDYQVGDVLHLREWNPDTRQYTSDSVRMVVTYVLQGEFGLQPNQCVMSLRPAGQEDIKRAIPAPVGVAI